VVCAGAVFWSIFVSVLGCRRVDVEQIRTRARPGLFEGRRRQHEQHQRFASDEAGGEWDVVAVFGLRTHLVPHMLNDPADHSSSVSTTPMTSAIRGACSALEGSAPPPPGPGPLPDGGAGLVAAAAAHGAM